MGNIKTYHIITIGCQMNKSDSERIAGYLEDSSFKFTADRLKADVVVATTCGVRQSAEDRVYGILPKIKKVNPQGKIVLTGCLAGRADVQKRLKNSVDIWLPINELTELGRRLNYLAPFAKGGNNKEVSLSLRRRGKKGEVSDGSVGGYLKINPKYESPISAFVPIGNGCNNFCAYCVVPYARGREVYRPAEEILAEVRGLVEKGYKEIILIAQNVNSYKSHNTKHVTPLTPLIRGAKTFSPQLSAPLTKARFAIARARRGVGGIREGRGFQDDRVIDFADLLKMVNDVPGDFWIRFATSHPKDMSDELIKTIAECKKVCHQIHLPAQAGDNKVLARMNRKYTVKHYENLIKKIRGLMPEAAITTDIIVGFPGETKAQFNNTAGLFRKIKFDLAYIARYSPRPGTAAGRLKDDVPKAEKKRREEALLKILRKIALENNKKYLGRTVEVLVDGKRREDYFGKTGTGKNVKIKPHGGKAPAIGNFIAVKIAGARDFGLTGKLF